MEGQLHYGFPQVDFELFGSWIESEDDGSDCSASGPIALAADW
jgi:hypothetical protein